MSPTGTRRAENGKWQQVAVWLRNSPGEALWEEAKQDCFCDNVFWVTENVEVFQETWLANSYLPNTSTFVFQSIFKPIIF